MKPFAPQFSVIATLGLLALAPALCGADGTAKGDANGQVVLYGFPDTSAATSGHALIALPKYMIAVGLADDGTVILQSPTESDKFGYRWKNGELTPLNLPAEIAANPDNYLFFPWSFTNRMGGVATNYIDVSGYWKTPFEDVVGALVWPPGEVEPVRAVAPRVNYWNEQILEYALLSYYDSQGKLWGSAVHGRFPVGATNTYSSIDFDFVVWDPPGYTAAVLASNNDRVFPVNPFPSAFTGVFVPPIAVNSSGVVVGQRDKVINGVTQSHYFVGSPAVAADEVAFEPRAINDAGWVLGRRTSPIAQNILWKKMGPDAPLELPLPAGEITELDAANNLHGLLPDGTKVMWTTNPVTRLSDPATGTYAPIAYVRPLLPSGWTSNLKIVPGSPGLKLGTGTFDDPATPAIDPEDRSFVLVPAALAVDANRDGAIKVASEDASDATSAAKPYRFWLNDDVDRHNMVDASGSFAGFDVQDDLNPTEHNGDLDWQRNTVPGTRDLEDWARLWINIGGLQDMIASGQIAIGLKWKNVTGTPSIKLLRAYEANGGAAYLTSTTVASTQVTGSYGSAIVNAAGSTTLIEPTNADWDFVIPTAALGNFSANNPTAHFLFEGCQRGKGELTIVLLKNTGGSFTKLGDGPGLWLDLKNIKEMYERWTVGDGPAANWLTGAGGGGAPADNATISQDRLPAGATAGQYTAQSPEQNQYILHVHGWNMHPWEKDAFTETAFKRLYWQGYRGRFGSFQWPTTYHDHDFSAITDYDEGEHTAWLTATPLKNLLVALHQQYGANVYVLAHSMGNVVTGEALRLAATTGAGQVVKAYIASQAAVPGQCYDPAATTSSPLSFGFLGFYGPNTANIYNNWFTPNSGGVGTKANFYNANDFALNSSHWQLGQKFKPDDKAGHWSGTPPNTSGPPYGYTGNPAAAPVQTGFFKTTFGPDPNNSANHVQTGILSLSLEDRNSVGTVTNLHDRYEIMAFAAEPRSLALGAVPSVSGMSAQNLQGIWPPDPFNLSQEPSSNYSSHPWHSAQFRFDNMAQANYWKTLLGPNGFDLQSP